jgi:hypothetical protein
VTFLCLGENQIILSINTIDGTGCDTLTSPGGTRCFAHSIN